MTNITNPFISDRANTQSLGAALVMRWNLDFVGGYHRTRRSEAQLAQLQAQDQQARDGVRLEVIATYEQLRDADRREVAWAQGERQTRSWFVAAGQAYQVGTSEPRELVDAMKAYFTNRFNHLEALREFKAGRRYSPAEIDQPAAPRKSSRSSKSDPTLTEQMTKMVMKELTGTTGRRIVRGILGGLFKDR